MAKPSSILTPETDRAHYVAQATLCVLAGIVVLALSWTSWHGGFSAAGAGPKAAVVEANKSPSDAPSSLNMPAPILPSPPALTTTLPTFPPQLTPSNPANPAPPVGKPIENPQVKEMVDAAREVRRLGDMQAAIESLRAADLREPNHPEIMSEIALTYEAMGLADKSQAAWRNVLALGEPVANGFYTLAKSKLEGREESPSTVVSSNKTVVVGACQVLPDTTVTKGQRLTLRVPIIAAPGAEVDPAQMDIHVYFYDKVGKDRVEPSKADQPEQKWVSQRVDWALHNEELLDVVYHMPELRPEELRDLGKRSYYGYVVKLFYQNRLMSQKADPPSLLDFKPAAPGSAGVENALFPKN